MYGSVILRRNDVDDDGGGQDFAQTNVDAVTSRGSPEGSWELEISTTWQIAPDLSLRQFHPDQ